MLSLTAPADLVSVLDIYMSFQGYIHDPFRELLYTYPWLMITRLPPRYPKSSASINTLIFLFLILPSEVSLHVSPATSRSDVKVFKCDGWRSSSLLLDGHVQRLPNLIRHDVVLPPRIRVIFKLVYSDF